MVQPLDLKVTSHVSRDLLASAAAFKNESAVVWEYVVNSLQYVDRDASPKVQVVVKPRAKVMEIHDNGAGMDAAGLEHYFQMHGENVERKRGRTGRGKFGTGKSAAFGIGKQLRVDTRQGGLRNVIELTRDAIDQSAGHEIPLDWQVRNEATNEPNGTIVTITEIVLRRIDTPSIIEYVERHLQAFRTANPEVAINDHLCTYREPQVASEHRFTPSPEQSAVLGDIEMTVKVAQAPLPEADHGVFVTAGVGNLVAVERAGIERKEFGSYLFGEIDVPALEAGESLLEPYDSSRSLTLNPAHPVVAVLVGFIGSKLEQVRLQLVADAKEARKSEQARRLAQEADKIAAILNDDFEMVHRRLEDIRSAASAKGSVSASFGDSGDAGSEQDEWVRGTLEVGEVELPAGKGGAGAAAGRKTPHVTARGERTDDGSSAVDPAGGSTKKRAKPRGGFRVEYRNLGKEERRSIYDPTIITILINLDHPVVSAALGDGPVEEPTFRRLSYEISFSEYAMALGYEMLQQDPDIPGDDLLYEVRASLNRISVSAASLYR